MSPTRELAVQIAAVVSSLLQKPEGEEEEDGDSSRDGRVKSPTHSPSLTPLRSLLLTGGSDPAADVAAWTEQGGNIVVGTPGRLEDIMNRLPRVFNVSRLEVLVLDEADRLLDMGFKGAIESILPRLPKNSRRTGLFSATQTNQVTDLIRAGLRNPMRVAVSTVHATPGGSSSTPNGGGEPNGGGDDGSRVTPSSLTNYYAVVPAQDKLGTLLSFLAAHATSKMIVYFATGALVDYFTAIVPGLLSTLHPPQASESSTSTHSGSHSTDSGSHSTDSGAHSATASAAGGLSKKARARARARARTAAAAAQAVTVLGLHGKMPTPKRASVYKQFVDAPSAAALFVTDLAARGLDIPDVDWICQYDPPSDPSAFVHRVGRTARLGRTGAALVLLTDTEDDYVEFLRIRGVPTRPADPAVSPPPAGDWTVTRNAVMAAALRDRAIYDAAQKAFVSFIRAYSEHKAKLLFQLRELDLAATANGLGLLRLPASPEVKRFIRPNARVERRGELSSDPLAYKLQPADGRRPAVFVQTLSNPAIDAVTYADANRQKQREVRVAASIEAGLGTGSKLHKRKSSTTASWSRVKEKKERKSKKRRGKDRDVDGRVIPAFEPANPSSADIDRIVALELARATGGSKRPRTETGGSGSTGVEPSAKRRMVSSGLSG